jgi:hypothetical protein
VRGKLHVQIRDAGLQPPHAHREFRNALAQQAYVRAYRPEVAKDKVAGHLP